MVRSIQSVLIANRGEIAYRVAKTARRLGIRTVGLYSEADVDAWHLTLMDQAFFVGPAPAVQSYLAIDRIIDIALKANVDAIHPGYGFLSENATFAVRCAEAGMRFVGPPPDAIRLMGNKSESKQRMTAAGVPTLPGYDGDDQSLSTLEREAKRIGYPLIVKAAMGGGGKGMRVVARDNQLLDAISAAKREAQSAFGDDRVLLEQYIDSPKHIEIQVFGDEQGNQVYLHERECSIQRRHQKIIEECPSPIVDPDLRQRMGQAAVAVAKAIGYTNAGTVEFLLNGRRDFFFLEMNTRLQVEHPVTEMVTGLDLVEWQFAVAAGKPLPLAQARIPLNGHAIEARLYAEDTGNGFLPTAGKLQVFDIPLTDEQCRLDTGVCAGSVIPVHYDPMIAKVIVKGDTRSQAIARLLGLLSHSTLLGVMSNVDYLQRVLAHAEFQIGRFDTHFIDKHLPPTSERLADSPYHLIAATIIYLNQLRQSRDRAWPLDFAWRNNPNGFQQLTFAPLADTEAEIMVHYLPLSTTQLMFRIGSLDYQVSVQELLGAYGCLLIDGQRYPFATSIDDDRVFIKIDGRHQACRLRPRFSTPGELVAEGSLKAPMPGKITKVLAPQGSLVEKGQPVLILEAMKMEHTIAATASGIVETIHYHEGTIVEADADLVTIGKRE